MAEENPDIWKRPVEKTRDAPKPSPKPPKK